MNCFLCSLLFCFVSSRVVKYAHGGLIDEKKSIFLSTCLVPKNDFAKTQNILIDLFWKRNKESFLVATRLATIWLPTVQHDLNMSSLKALSLKDYRISTTWCHHLMSSLDVIFSAWVNYSMFRHGECKCKLLQTGHWKVFMPAEETTAGTKKSKQTKRWHD